MNEEAALALHRVVGMYPMAERRLRLLISLAPLCGLLLAGCGADMAGKASDTRGGGDTEEGSGGGASTGSGAGYPTGPSTGAAPPTSGGTPPTGGEGSGGQLPAAGQLTAGAWDDNLNFDFYGRYSTRMLKGQQPGFPTVPISDRMQVLVKDPAGKPVPGATVEVTSGDKLLGRLQTGADGRVLVFPTWLGAQTGSALTISALYGDAQGGHTTAKAGDLTATVTISGAAGPITGLDIALVIDTTGSMGDEILYLQAETLAISSAIRAAYPQLSQRWALVAYRDYTDSFVSKATDFTEDLKAYQANLSTLQAGGGGDRPEAPEKALADMNQLTWRGGPVARVAFWLADAPHHAEHTDLLVKGIREANAKGVHFYPIAASDTDELTEFSMRLAALVTGGRYLFLTNDSRIGNDHKEPRIPCYLVTSLQKAMLRMVSMEVTGQHVEPAKEDVIRTGGNPMDQRCTLSDGEVVEVL